MCFIAELSRSNAREICTCNSCRLIGVKTNSLCYIISLFSYILRVRFGNRVRRKPRKKIVPTSQIIEGWANHDPLSRSRLYFMYFQTCSCLFGTGFVFDFNRRLSFIFFRFRDEKLTRSIVRFKRERR